MFKKIGRFCRMVKAHHGLRKIIWSYVDNYLTMMDEDLYDENPWDLAPEDHVYPESRKREVKMEGRSVQYQIFEADATNYKSKIGSLSLINKTLMASFPPAQV